MSDLYHIKWLNTNIDHPFSCVWFRRWMSNSPGMLPSLSLLTRCSPGGIWFTKHDEDWALLSPRGQRGLRWQQWWKRELKPAEFLAPPKCLPGGAGGPQEGHWPCQQCTQWRLWHRLEARSFASADREGTEVRIKCSPHQEHVHADAVSRWWGGWSKNDWYLTSIQFFFRCLKINKNEIINFDAVMQGYLTWTSLWCTLQTYHLWQKKEKSKLYLKFYRGTCKGGKQGVLEGRGFLTKGY